MPQSRPIALTEGSFRRQVLDVDGVVLVGFHAVRCGASDALLPAMSELATEFSGRAIVATVDAARQTRLAARYGIRSTPSTLFFRGGELVHQLSGAVPKTVLAARLECLVASNESK